MYIYCGRCCYGDKYSRISIVRLGRLEVYFARLFLVVGFYPLETKEWYNRSASGRKYRRGLALTPFMRVSPKFGLDSCATLTVALC